MVTITTSQAPEARPVGVTITLTAANQAMITVPNYSVPSDRFAGGAVTVPGYAEIISPLILSNKTATVVTVTAQIYRISSGTAFSVATAVMVPGNDVVAIPLQGQFLQTDDELRILASVAGSVDATISYTLGRAEQNDIS